MKHRKTVIWGGILIAIGILIALFSLGIVDLPFSISPGRIIFGVFVLCVFVDSLANLNLTLTFLALGSEILIFEEQLGLLLGKGDGDWISGIGVILISLLIGGGLDLVLSEFKKKHKFKKRKHFGVEINAFSDHLKYIDASKLRKEYINNKFGDFEIRFENSDEYCGGGEITIENTFGDVTVFVPSDWEIEISIDNSFGDLTVDDVLKVRYADGSGKRLLIKGKNSFGDLEIKAI